MDLLRWILLAVGVGVILAIYLVGRIRGRRDSAVSRYTGDYYSGDETPMVPQTRSDALGRDPADQELAELARGISLQDTEEPLAVDKSAAGKGTGDAAPATGASSESPEQAPAADPAAQPDTATARRAAQSRTRSQSRPPSQSRPEARTGTGESAEPASQPQETKPYPGEKIVVAYLVAPGGGRFRGPELLQAFDATGLAHGDMNIFHYDEDSDSGRHRLFSVANVVEPGWFDPQHMDEFETPGLAFFLQLPGPPDGVHALDVMLDCALRMRERLEGDLLDSSRSVMSRQTMAHLREEVQEFSRKSRSASSV